MPHLSALRTARRPDPTPGFFAGEISTSELFTGLRPEAGATFVSYPRCPVVLFKEPSYSLCKGKPLVAIFSLCAVHREAAAYAYELLGGEFGYERPTSKDTFLWSPP